MLTLSADVLAYNDLSFSAFLVTKGASDLQIVLRQKVLHLGPNLALLEKLNKNQKQ